MKNNDILKLAFEEAAEKELKTLPEEGNIVRPYSKNFNKKMDKLFDEVGQDRTVSVRRKKIKWAALIAAVLMCVTLTVTVSATDLTPKEMLMLMGLWREPDLENYVTVDWEIKGAYAAGRAEEWTSGRTCRCLRSRYSRLPDGQRYGTAAGSHRWGTSGT